MIDNKPSFSVRSIRKYYHYIHQNNYIFPGHRHTGTELNIILDGAMEITCGHNIFQIDSGNIAFIPQGTFHQNRVVGNRSAEMVVIHFETIEPLETQYFSVQPMSDETRKLVDCFCLDIEHNAAIEHGTCLFLNDTAKKLLEVILQYAYAPNVRCAQKNSEGSRIYRTAAKYMTEHLASQLTVADVAKHCGVCATTLKNVFSYYTGRGCITYFNELKLARAKELLSAGSSCADTATALGFSSQAYFSKKFKQMYDTLPSKVKG